MIVFVTCGSDEEARKISELLVRERVAACANVAEIESVFEWKGKLENQAEKLLIIKTIQSRYGELERLVKANHSYECPEIMAIEVRHASKEYENWLLESCKNTPKSRKGIGRARRPDCAD